MRLQFCSKRLSNIVDNAAIRQYVETLDYCPTHNPVSKFGITIAHESDRTSSLPVTTSILTLSMTLIFYNRRRPVCAQACCTVGSNMNTTTKMIIISSWERCKLYLVKCPVQSQKLNVPGRPDRGVYTISYGFYLLRLPYRKRLSGSSALLGQFSTDWRCSINSSCLHIKTEFPPYHEQYSASLQLTHSPRHPKRAASDKITAPPSNLS